MAIPNPTASRSSRRPRFTLAIAGKYLLFLGPAAALYLPFVLRPLIETFYLSLHQWNGVSPDWTFFGLDNFVRAFSDRIFWTALFNNFLWVVASFILPMGFGLVLAVMISNVGRGQKIYSGIFFMPVVLNLIIVALVWGLIYNPLIGPLNRFLKVIGLGAYAKGWLGDSLTATPAIIFAGNWTFFGFCTVIFLQGLRTMNVEQLEAATLDGANAVRKFFHIVVPSLADQVRLIAVLSVIGSFKVFDIVYVMTKGGPNHASEVIATYMYWQSFMNGSLGYGAALAVLLTVFVASASCLLMMSREPKR
ncbi:carbohydrate ABC transporter permease [Kaistia terrae]|uniref:Carbohydrate ABC transporter permease n=1 Tax=Kaistia terrae TaxID=537017 RepID=A0ABW0PTQ5_9HYPH|nr:sugar ABC transporter permease [Kaistia terrae]MCX5578137.1 sugar ABC transporter permease [Kaistia terrae]